MIFLIVWVAAKTLKIFCLSTSSSAAPGSAWDDADWDTASWAQENIIRAAWSLQGKYGNTFSTRLNISTKDQVVKWLQNGLHEGKRQIVLVGSLLFGADEEMAHWVSERIEGHEPFKIVWPLEW